ncbi:hypothetical protein FSP39_008736 [Pinctada imbricata]|uniref:Coiled-coil domain-containing protein 149 n=1 Tax=Pinctada imbricata TaxID=66713 RepID=A0AA88XIG4_PINIB|nr:hypothetical protein FSP39_008736 [Pinctada imbricata]
MSTFRKTEEDFMRLESRFETLRNEYHVCKRKLDSKCQALLILSKELDQCRSERDQFKLMAEQLRERYQGIKKHLIGKSPSGSGAVSGTKYYQGRDAMLYEEREQNKSLQFEVEDLKQKLHDAQGDIKLLREQIARQRVGTTDEGMNTRYFPAHERENLVRQLEESREQYTQLERDLQQVLDEREETITEKDAYKSKYERLNQELNYILKGDEKRVVDLDAIIMENKYLQERLKQMEEEKTMAMATVSKYKNLLERKKLKSSIKLGQSRSGGLVITQKQVHQVLESQDELSPSPQAMADVKALASALLDTVNDKNLALSHQRKTNNQDELSPSPQAMADVKALASALLDTVNDKNLALSHQRKTNNQDELSPSPPAMADMKALASALLDTINDKNLALSQQLHQVLESQDEVSPSPQAIADVKALASALLDTVNDKNLALSHQRKTNKILGNRIAELEKKIKTLEVAGLWNIPSSNMGIEKLRSECEDVKTLLPQMSTSSDDDKSFIDNIPHGTSINGKEDEEFCSPSPLSSSTNTSPLHSSSAHSISYSPDLSSPAESICHTPAATCHTPLLDRQNDHSSLSTPKSSPKRNIELTDGHGSPYLSEKESSINSCDARSSVNNDLSGVDSRKKKKIEKGDSSEKETLLDNEVLNGYQDDVGPNRLVSDTMEIIDTDVYTDSSPREVDSNSPVMEGTDDYDQDTCISDTIIQPTDTELSEMEAFCSENNDEELSEEKLSELVENMTTRMLTTSQVKSKANRNTSLQDNMDQSESKAISQSEFKVQRQSDSVDDNESEMPNSSSSLLEKENCHRNVMEEPRNVEC